VVKGTGLEMNKISLCIIKIVQTDWQVMWKCYISYRK